MEQTSMSVIACNSVTWAHQPLFNGLIQRLDRLKSHFSKIARGPWTNQSLWRILLTCASYCFRRITFVIRVEKATQCLRLPFFRQQVVLWGVRWGREVMLLWNWYWTILETKSNNVNESTSTAPWQFYGRECTPFENYPQVGWNKARRAANRLAEQFLEFKYLRKISHDARPLGLQHFEYQVLCIRVYHAVPGPPEAILLMLTI